MIYRNVPIDNSRVPLILWANGLVRRVVGRNQTSGWVGWYTQQGLNQNFDSFAELHRIPTVVLQHRISGGVAMVSHWSLSEKILFAPVTAGPIETNVMSILSDPDMHERTIEAGIVVQWERDDQGRSRARAAVRGFLSVFAQEEWVRYPSLVQITARGIMAQRLLDALYAHCAVCAVADKVWGRTVYYPDLFLPLETCQVERLQSREGFSTEVTTFSGRHPSRQEEITPGYLESIALRMSQDELNRAWMSVQQWARQSFQMYLHRTRSVESEESVSEEPARDRGDAGLGTE